MSNDHYHHHNHDCQGQMPFDEKLLNMHNHRIKHNEVHALNYRNCAGKAKTNSRAEAGELLKKAAEMSPAIKGFKKPQ